MGLSTGTLRAYRLQDTHSNDAVGDEPSPDEEAKLLKEEEKFSRYKIEQLAYIKEVPALVSLSNGLVSFHDPNTYQLQEHLAKSKGASVFAVTSNVVKDEATGVPQIVSRLAVAVKRKLLLWSWHDSEVNDENPEFTLVTGIKSLTWVTGTRLVVGLTASYVLIDVEYRKVSDIVGPGSIGGGPGQDSGRFGVAGMGYMGMGGMVPKPLATRLGEGEVLLAKDINTHFTNTEGEPLGRRQIPWATAPDAIGYSYPFLLALQSGKGGMLEVRNPATLASLQSLSLKDATMMCVPNPYVSLAHAGKGFLVASEKCVWRMDALGYDDQIEGLFEKGLYDEAISLLGMLEDALLRDKSGRLREAKMLKAQALFDQKRYRDSLDLFTEASAPPERVISMYPSIISGEMESTKEQDDEAEAEAKEKGSEAGSLPGTPSKNDKKRQPSPQRSIRSKGNGEPMAAENDDNASLLSVPIVKNFRRRVLEGKELRTAANELRGFLVDARTKLQQSISWDGSIKEASSVAEAEVPVEALLVPQQPGDERSRQERLIDTFRLVDTTLFRTYMLASPSLAGSLFRLPNFCEPEVVKEKLLESKRYVDLIDFLYGKGLHSEALRMLQEFGKNSKDDVPEALRGPQRTVAYLQNLDPAHIELILQYAHWPITVDPRLGMEVFVADTENAETLPRDRVLGFLGSIDRKDKQLETRYLEHIIHELDDDKSIFHQRLIDLYLETVKCSEGKDKTRALEKLLELLRTSKHYESWSLLKKLPKDDADLHEARAIILGNMGQYRQALSIYAFDMGDAAKAEDYCNQVYVSEADSSDPTSPARKASTSTSEGSLIYHDLLSLYLSPPPPQQSQWEPALDILAKHGSRLPASSTLSLIPESLLIRKLEEYFTTRIRAANTIVNEARITAGLRKTVDVEEEVKLRLGSRGRNRSVVVTEERVCPVCHKRFGGSVLKVLPE